MKIFEDRQNLCQYDDQRMLNFSEKDLNKFDEMLTAAGVEHMFTLPTDEDVEALAKEGKDAEVVVWYMDDDFTAFSLVYMLWAKQIRKASDYEIAKAEAKLVRNWNEKRAERITIDD